MSALLHLLCAISKPGCLHGSSFGLAGLIAQVKALKCYAHPHAGDFAGRKLPCARQCTLVITAFMHMQR